LGEEETMSGTRLQCLQALETLIGNCYPWQTPISRRLKLWADVPKPNRPQAFLFGGGDEKYTWTQGPVPKRVINCALYAYFDASDQTVNGSDILDNFMDTLDAAMLPAGVDMRFGKNRLGGLCDHCRIAGELLKVPGDVDGDCLLRVPFEIILP
jgi:hypothetical protein